MTDTNANAIANANVIEQTLRISARPETVWRYWTDPQRMCQWWGVAAQLDPRPGGMWRIDMGEEGRVMLGEYLELAPYERLVFSFGYGQTEGALAIAPCASLVEVTLVEDDGDTILTLRHTGIPEALGGSHAAGWTRHLPLLAAAISTRVPR